MSCRSELPRSSYRMAAVSEVQRVLVYGGRGALGSKCVDYFRSKQWWVASIDITENASASASIVVKLSDSFSEQSDQVTSAVEELLGGQKVDAILCVAGGWAGGSAKAKLQHFSTRAALVSGVLLHFTPDNPRRKAEAFYKSCDQMWKQSVWTSAISSHLATKHLREGGLLTLSGANAGLSATPGMSAYGMSKAAVHQLCQSLGAEKSGMPAKSAAVAVLPVTLDTPANRASMPDADYSSWTPLDFIAETFYNWTTGQNRPQSGSLIQVITEKGKTELVPAHL